MVKLGFTGVYIIFLISVLNINCGTLEPPSRGGSNIPTIYVLSRNMKIIRSFYYLIFFVYLNRYVFIMC